MAYDKSLKFEHNLEPKATDSGSLGSISSEGRNAWERVVVTKLNIGAVGDQLPQDEAMDEYEEGDIFCLLVDDN